MTSANRIAKEQKVTDLSKRFGSVQAAIVSKISGIKVEEMTAFRTKLRKEGVKFEVIKNSLALRAIQGTSLDSLKDQFYGPTGVSYTDSDPISLAKLITAFSKTQKNFEIRAGVLNGELLTVSQLEALAQIPSREVLLSRLVGSLQAPYANLAYVLSGVLRKLVYALEAVRSKKEQQGK